MGLLVFATGKIGEALGRMLHFPGDQESDGTGIVPRPMAAGIPVPGPGILSQLVVFGCGYRLEFKADFADVGGPCCNGV